MLTCIRASAPPGRDQEEFDREKERIASNRELQRAERELAKQKPSRRRRGLQGGEGGTPRAHRSVEQEILGSLDVARERSTLHKMQTFYRQASSWDLGHDDALHHLNVQTRLHRDLAEELKTKALREMRAKKSIGARELDHAQFEQAYNEMLLAYQMTSFENSLHEYQTCNQQLLGTRKKFIGFPPRQTEYWMEKLPAKLHEVSERYYVWRRPELVDELKSLQLFDIETLDSPPHDPRPQERHLPATDEPEGCTETLPKSPFVDEGSQQISPTGELGSSHNIFPLPSAAVPHTPTQRPEGGIHRGPVPQIHTAGSDTARAAAHSKDQRKPSTAPHNRTPSPQKSWIPSSPTGHRQIAARWEKERRLVLFRFLSSFHSTTF